MWPSLLLLSACFRLPAEWTDESLYLILDPHTDRPRMLAARVDPPFVVAGQSITVDALFLGPTEVTSVRSAVCGLSDEVAVEVRGLTCFTEADLVQQVATGLPFRWQVPLLPGISREDCDGGDSGLLVSQECVSRVPLRLDATFADGEVAYGSLLLPILLLPDGVTAGERAVLADHPMRVSATGPTAPGSEVALEAAILGPVDEVLWQDFRWYVDGGTLRDTGRTTAQSVSYGHVLTRNRLVIPDDWSGPLRIVVVAEGDLGTTNPAYVGDMAWVVHTIDVGPTAD